MGGIEKDEEAIQLWIDEAPKERRFIKDASSSGSSGMRGSENDVVIFVNPDPYSSPNEMMTRARQRLIFITDVNR